MEEINSIFVICVLLELFVECGVSPKYKQYFLFLTGLIITTVLTGTLLNGIGQEEKEAEVEMERALLEWEQFCEEYEVEME